MISPPFDQVLSEYCGLKPSALTLVGVSGGPDSLTLLDVLIQHGYRVAVAHFNHHLREEAETDAGVVKAAAELYKCEFYEGEGDVRALVKEERLTIEEAARKARYRFLFETAGRIGAQALAVGHNADDQVETILMHLLRGSGLAGLRGMPWQGFLPEFDPDLKLVRPLLGWWREEIVAYCRERGLHPVTDLSNFDATYYRNKLRLELVPYLKQYNPRAKELLWRTGQTLQGDFEIVEGAVREAERNVQPQNGSGFVRWDREYFKALPAGIRHNLIRAMISRLRRNTRDIDFETVERALAFVDAPSRSGEIELALGLNILVEGGEIVLKEKNIELTDPVWPRLEQEELTLPLPGRIELADGWTLTAEILEWKDELISDMKCEPGDEMTGWLDRDKLPEVLTVRRYLPGDRMKPHGFDGHSIKVSDVWVNIKLPRQARKCWPLVCSGAEIAWLPGYRPGSEFTMDEKTHRVVRLRLRKTE